MRLIVGITGATGSIYGIRMLEVLAGSDVQTYLIVSKWGARTLVEETEFDMEKVERLANCQSPANEQDDTVASSSFLADGMVVAPCSMRTLAAIATGQGEHLVHRAADVILKEKRKLVLVVRETPLHEIHLENMWKLSRMGVVIF